MNCERCGQEIELDAPKGVGICGSCADDLRQEQQAEVVISQQPKAIVGYVDL